MLGAKGSTARAIREKTSTQLRVREIHPDTGLQTITLIGAVEQVKEAYGMVSGHKAQGRGGDVRALEFG